MDSVIILYIAVKVTNTHTQATPPELKFAREDETLIV